MRSFCLQILVLAMLIFIQSSDLAAQSISNFTNFVDFNKNGFLETKYFDGHSILLKKAPLYSAIHDDQNASKIERTRKVIIYYKPNGKMILIWGDSKERVVQNEYDEILQIGVNTYKVLKGENWGVIDSLGKTIIPFEYSNIEPVDPQLRYPENNQIYQSEYNLEVQLFFCKKSGWTRENSIINRNGNVLIENTSPTVNYFIHNKQLYTVFEQGDQFLIGRFGEIPKLAFEGKIYYDDAHNSVNFSKWLVNKLIKPVRKENEIIFFDFSKQSFIQWIPSFSNFGKSIGDKYLQTITHLDNSSENFTLTILSNELTIVEQDAKYLEVSDFPCLSCYEELPDVHFIQRQIDKDSLLLFTIRDPESSLNNPTELVGIYKIGYGELVEASYESISRVNKNICLITEADGIGNNFLDLKTLKKLFPNNFESIKEVSSGERNNLRVFECINEGKVTKVSFPNKVK